VLLFIGGRSPAPVPVPVPVPVPAPAPAPAPAPVAISSAKNALVDNRGAVDFKFGNTISTGLGYGSICPHTVQDHHLQSIFQPSRGNVARIVFMLGDSVYDICGKEGEPGRFPSTWNGTDFDFGSLAREIQRRLKVNPDLKVILQIALDGSKQWLNLPANAQNQPNADFRARGIPDYASAEWREFASNALTTLVRSVENSQYANVIVGYELFNGSSFDVNPWHSLHAPAARQQFKAFIRTKYQNDVARLRSAWNDPALTFETVEPVFSLSEADRQRALQLAPLFAPAMFPALADTKEYRSIYDQQIIEHFARTIKTASKGQALVGVRSGELFVAPWKNDEGAYASQGSPVVYRNFAFYQNPDIDFYEVWDHYGPGRYTGWLAGGTPPLMPNEGLRLLRKKYVLQNDYRVGGRNAGDKNYGFGYDDSIEASVAKQKRVFSAALTAGLSPYLWEMSYDYAQDPLLALWDRQQTISKKSKLLDQSSKAEVAIVVDAEVQKYFSIGFPSVMRNGRLKTNTPAEQEWMDEPGFSYHLVNIPMNSWARIGAPTDMLFFNQLETTNKRYKVYMFYHTFAFSDAEIARIHAFLEKNKATGVFVYADGMMDEKGSVDMADMGRRISALTKMNIQGSMQARLSQLQPTKFYEDYAGPVTDLRRWETPTGRYWDAEKRFPVIHNVFPSFVVNPQGSDAIPLATYRQNVNETSIAMKRLPRGGSIVYSATPHIPPALFRNILIDAKVTTYIDSEDLFYMNSSFIGFTPESAKDITLKLPATAVLYDVFNDFELTAATQFSMSVKANEPYLFFRGTRAAWNALPN
jgi:hypothetical protein